MANNTVKLGGISLIPAPSVSTSYEYSKSGEYIIGGFLIVTLSGKIISESVLSELNSISQLSAGNNCISLNIGCNGGEFLSGASGKIRSADVSIDDQPFLGSYTIQVAVETINGNPAVAPDSQFLKSTCLSNAEYIQSYTESIGINADANSIGLVDGATGLSKSFIKANGQITLVGLCTLVCGKPEFTTIDNLVSILQTRAASLLGLQSCEGSILSSYNGWNKWIDTQTLDVNSATGTITWSFDMYMSKGSSAPYAWADVTIEDKYDQKKLLQTKTMSGTIRGLSAASGGFLGNKLTSGERLDNAKRGYDLVTGMLMSGGWPSSAATIDGGEGNCTSASDPCKNPVEATCLQRISSNVTTSVVNGEISFSSEFGSISACKPNQESQIDVTVDETLPATRYVEIFVPNGRRSTVVNIGDTPGKVTIMGKGTLKGCDTTQMGKMKNCVQAEISKALGLYRGWLKIKENESFGSYSYSKTLEYIRCG